MKSAGGKKTINTPLSLEGDKEVAIMMIIVIINKVLLFLQNQLQSLSYTNLGTSSYFSKLFTSFLEVSLCYLFHISRLVSSRFMEAPAWKYDLSVPNPYPLSSTN